MATKAKAAKKPSPKVDPAYTAPIPDVVLPIEAEAPTTAVEAEEAEYQKAEVEHAAEVKTAKKVFKLGEGSKPNAKS